MNFLITFIFTLSSLFLNAQLEDAQWLFGGTGASTDPLYQTSVLDFQNGSREVRLRDDRFVFYAQNASICDNNGNLLYYTNGSAIYNYLDSVIENGENYLDGNNFDITGYAIPQNNLLLLHPNNSRKVVFIGSQFKYVPQNSYTYVSNSPIHYSIIDMEANGGLGRVDSFKQVLIQDTIELGKMCAVRHANGRDWWIVNESKEDKSRFYFSLLDPNGIRLHHTQDIEKSLIGLGQAAFSADGNWYAMTKWAGIVGQGDMNYIDLYRFDRCTGTLSAYETKDFGTKIGPSGIAFSPNSKLMYVSVWDSIYQYDLTAIDILGSELTVAGYNGGVDSTGTPLRFYTMGLAPDNKIYISVSNYNTYFLHVIDAPNVRGVGCSVLQAGVQLPSYNNWAMPNLPNPRLGAEVGSSCDSLGSISTDLPKENMEEGISIFPNPAKDNIYVQIPKKKAVSAQIVLFDSTGRQIKSQKLRADSETIEFDISGYSAGIYMLIFKNKKGRIIDASRFVISE